MAKGCLLIVGVSFLTLLSIILAISIFSAKPASKDEVLAILENNLNDDESIQVYSELIDYLTIHKEDVFNSVSKTSDCVEFNISKPIGRRLPNELMIGCQNILSESRIAQPPTLMICQNNVIILKTFQIDNTNYLYITRLYFLKDSFNKSINLERYRGRLIKGKYFYFVGIEDAFNHLEPNKVVPN